MISSKVEWVEIGELVTLSDERNSNGLYTLDNLRGISIQKKFIDSKANMEGVSLYPYKLVKPNYFCYVTITSRNSDKITLALNIGNETYIVSSSYEVFYVSDLNRVLPEYIYLWFCRPEFDRYARFHSWGSAREAFSYDDMCRVRIPLPSIEEQQTIVEAWKSLRNIKEQNEALAAPLMQLCQSYIQECKHKYPLEELRHFITEVNERNVDEVYSVEDVRGLATSKEIIPTKANMGGVSVKSYKVFRPEQFAFVDDTSRRGNRMSLAVNMSDDTYIVSSISTIVNITDKQKLLPQFLKLWFDRSEFDRYARFHSWGSARESFTFEDMQRVRIPIPPIGVQRAIVSLYQCALEYKTIAAEADEQAKKICSPLLQQFIHQS